MIASELTWEVLKRWLACVVVEFFGTKVSDYRQTIAGESSYAVFPCIDIFLVDSSAMERADLCGSIDTVQTPYFCGRFLPMSPAMTCKKTTGLGKSFEHLSLLHSSRQNN